MQSHSLIRRSMQLLAHKPIRMQRPLVAAMKPITTLRKSLSSSAKPSNAFASLLNLECKLDEKKVFASNIEHVNHCLFHPFYFSFMMHTKSNFAGQAHYKIEYFQNEILGQLKKERQDSSSETEPSFVLKSGSFYTPYTTNEGIDAVKKARDEQIANAECLLTFPIFVRNEKEVLATIKKYCRLLGFSNIAEMQQKIPQGVVAYVSNNHSRQIEELRTLRYLSQSMSDDVSLEELGYFEIYHKFIKPKLIKSQKLINPESFNINILTASYTNRLFDMLMGMIHKVTLDHGGDPRLYLEKCYGFHLIANPYNYTKHWVDTTDWRSDVLKHVSSDIIWNFSDVATRVTSEHDLLLCHFRQFGNNIIKLKDTKRQSIIVVPEITQDYSNMSNSEIGATVLGHNLDSAIDSLLAQEPNVAKNLCAYLTRQISKNEFDMRRKFISYTYVYDPLVGVPLNHLLYKNDIGPETLLLNLWLAPEFLHELCAVTKGLQLIEHPTYFNNRIYLRYGRMKEGGVDLLPLNKTHLILYQPFDWLFFARSKDEHEIVRAVFFQHYIAKSIGQLLEKNPKDRVILEKFFAAYLNETLWRDNKSIESSLAYELFDFRNPQVLNKVFESCLKLIPDLKENSYLAAMQCFNLYSRDIYLEGFGLYVMEQIEMNDIETLKKSLDRLKQVQDLELKQDQTLGQYNKKAFNRLISRNVAIGPNQDIINGKEVIWNYVGKAIKLFLESGEINQTYRVFIRMFFSHVVCLKLRAANLSYTNYVESFYKTNKNNHDGSKLKPMSFNKSILNDSLSLHKAKAKYKLVNETGCYQKEKWEMKSSKP